MTAHTGQAIGLFIKWKSIHRWGQFEEAWEEPHWRKAVWLPSFFKDSWENPNRASHWIVHKVKKHAQMITISKGMRESTLEISSLIAKLFWRLMREPTQGKPFDYSQSEKSFTDEGNLKRHEWAHQERSSLTCKVIWRHMTDNKHYQPLECRQCEKAFTDESKFKVNNRTRTGEKLFDCWVALKTHVRTHTGQALWLLTAWKSIHRCLCAASCRLNPEAGHTGILIYRYMKWGLDLKLFIHKAFHLKYSKLSNISCSHPFLCYCIHFKFY